MSFTLSCFLAILVSLGKCLQSFVGLREGCKSVGRLFENAEALD